MSEPRQLAVVRSIEDLEKLCRERVGDIGATYAILDDYSRVADGYWSKKLASSFHAPSGKRGTKRGWSAEAFAAAMVTFCFDLVAVENPARIAKLQEWMAKTGEKRVYRPALPALLAGGKHGDVVIRFSWRHMKKMAKNGGRARREKLSPERRREIASTAAKRRWHKPEIVEVTNAAALQNVGALPISDFCVNARGRLAESKPSTTQPSAAKRGPARRR